MAYLVGDLPRGLPFYDGGAALFGDNEPLLMLDKYFFHLRCSPSSCRWKKIDFEFTQDFKYGTMMYLYQESACTGNNSCIK